MNAVIIYTEGGLKLGLGNVYRMLELVKTLKENKQALDIKFITSSEKYVIDLIKDNGFDSILSTPENLALDIAAQKFQVLVIDKLNIEEFFVEEIKSNKKEQFKIVLFGNNSPANKLADLVINAIVGTDFTNNVYTDSHGTRYLTGPKYLTLRSEFCYREYEHKNVLKNIILLFGGSDQANFSCRVLADLLQSSITYNITVVTGRGYKYNNELLSVKAGKDNVRLLSDISNVKEEMLKNDFLITSPGGTMFESFYLGLPCLALFQNDIQEDVFSGFFMTKSYNEIENIESYITSVYNNIESYHKRLDELEIGLGKQDIINNIIKLI